MRGASRGGTGGPEPGPARRTRDRRRPAGRSRLGGRGSGGSSPSPDRRGGARAGPAAPAARSVSPPRAGCPCSGTGGWGCRGGARPRGAPPPLPPLGGATRGPVGEDAVDEGSAPVAGRWVDDDPRRLVRDEQMLVLVRDPERDLLGRELRATRPRIGLELDVLPALKPAALRRLLSVHHHAATLEEALGRRTGAD